MAFTRIVVETNDTAQRLKDILLSDIPSFHRCMNALVNFFGALVNGSNSPVTVQMNTAAVKATGTGTFTGAPTADQTMTIAGVTFTAKDSGATGNQYNIGANVTATAANLVTAINASSDLTNILVASSSLGVVTLTAAVPGAMGNGLITVDVDTSNFTFAQAKLAGGSDGTAASLTH